MRQRYLFLWTALQAQPELRVAVARATADLVLALSLGVAWLCGVQAIVPLAQGARETRGAPAAPPLTGRASPSVG